MQLLVSVFVYVATSCGAEPQAKVIKTVGGFVSSFIWPLNGDGPNVYRVHVGAFVMIVWFMMKGVTASICPVNVPTHPVTVETTPEPKSIARQFWQAGQTNELLELELLELDLRELLLLDELELQHGQSR